MAKEKPEFPPYEAQCRREDHDRLNFVEYAVYELHAKAQKLEARLAEIEGPIREDLLEPAPAPAPAPAPKTLAELIASKEG